MEFALILPLLVLGAAFLLHLGLTLAVQLQLENAAREAARAAAVEPDRGSAVARQASQRAMGGRESSTSTIVGAEFVMVEVETKVAVVPLLGIGNRTIRADAVMRREDLIR